MEEEMARIRTIKPIFFKHECLFDAEHETGLPLRVAFAGLFTVADREGRFNWRPRSLKLECLPYDDVDFARVLDALATRGFIVKYEIEGEVYGYIPSWSKHQVINNREADSIIPPPPGVSKNNDLTREARVDDASVTPLVHTPAEGKGKEGKGTDSRVASGPTIEEWFERFVAAYPKREGNDPKKPAFEKFKSAVLNHNVNPEHIVNGAVGFAQECARKRTEPRYIPMMKAWLHQVRWEGYAETKVVTLNKVPVFEGTPQWEAWLKAGHNPSLKTDIRDPTTGRRRDGWKFVTEWPPDVKVAA